MNCNSRIDRRAGHARRRRLCKLGALAVASVCAHRPVAAVRFVASAIGGSAIGMSAARATGKSAAAALHAANGSSPSAASRPLVAPAPTTLEYAVYLDDYRTGARVASMTQQFDRNGARYDFRSESQATGLLALVWRGAMVQVSEGTIDARGLRPARFEDRRGNRKPRGARIDRSGGVATLLDGRQVPAPEGTQDRLSAPLQLGLLLAAGGPEGTPLPVGHEFGFPMLATSKVNPSRWRIESVEEVKIDSRLVRATRVRRLVPPDDDAPMIDLWFDAGNSPWPLRMRIAEADGQALDQVLLREP